MPEVKWNPEQQTAIEARGGSVLVSAAAGSGKTAVLVERAIRRITEDDAPVEADRLLVVTFTNAAAAEMRSRIRAALAERLAADPGSARLQRQQLLLERAHIQTIHSFCKELVQNYFHLLSIAPESRVADEHEYSLLKAEAVSEVIEEAYAAGDRTYCELVDTLGGGRSDMSFQNAVLTLHEFMRSHPFYEDWLREKQEMYDVSAAPEDTIWGMVLLEYAGAAFRQCAVLNRAARAISTSDSVMAKAYGAALSDDGALLERLIDAAESEAEGASRWDRVRAALKGAVFMPLGRLIGRKDDPEKKRVQALRDEYKATIKKLASEQFAADSAGFRGDIADLAPKIERLFALVLEFDRRYGEKKAARGVLDYSDLEQMALKVLAERAGDGSLIPTKAARELSESFDEIMVDEYQDVNRAQDAIFTAISKKGSNLFFVGDVKQSIYRFRQAMPELFLEKRRSWAPYDGERWPANIVLNRNYRSRREVTELVNFIFRRVMSTQVGEMEYLPEDELVSAAGYPEPRGVLNEALLVEYGEDERIESEAKAAARRIKELITGGVTVQDKQGERPARWSDVAVLLRSAKSRVDIYTGALRAEGVPCRSEQGSGFLSLPEVAAALDVLRAADDPLLDIPLAGAMLSEIFMFTPDELARLRLCDRNAHLWTAAVKAAAAGDPKAQKLMAVMEELRRSAAGLPADRVVERLYELTGLPEFMRVGQGGELRLANLRLLVKYAADRESAGCGGLPGFLRYLDRMEERGGDLSPAGSTVGGGDAVRLMSIHASKGLEFPIVFLCDTCHKFQFGDRADMPLLHPELGFACPRRDPDTGLRFVTVPQQAVKLVQRRASLSEELRILYVALTRAKERLVITAGVKNAARFLDGLSAGAFAGEKVPEYFTAGAASPAEWIFTALLPHPDAGELRREADISGLTLDCPVPVSFTLLRANDVTADTEAEEEAAPEPPAPDESAARLLRERLAWSYPYEPATRIPSKFGVSELTHEGVRQELRFTSRPSKGALTGAQRGTALHTFMQFADLEAARRDTASEIARLAERRFITEAQAAVIDVKKVRTFLESPLYKRIKESPWARRELRFLRSIPAGQLGFEGAAPEDRAAVQGVADCVFDDGGELTVVDYKTDFVTEPEELSRRYGEQLRLYKKLLSEALSRPVTRAVIWSFHLGEEIVISE